MIIQSAPPAPHYNACIVPLRCQIKTSWNAIYFSTVELMHGKCMRGVIFVKYVIYCENLSQTHW